MRRSVVALVAGAVVLVLAGCGGGGSETAATTAPPVAPPVARPAASTAATSNGEVGLSANEPPVFSPFPTGTPIPKEVADRIAAKQPTLIYFYDDTQNSSIESRKVIDSVLDDNRGLVDLVSYNLGKHVSGNAAQTATVDTSFPKDGSYAKAINLAQSLGVTYTPYLVLTDGQGYIVWKFRGLVDKDFLEREILRASN